jgi:hypothetical protein
MKFRTIFAALAFLAVSTAAVADAGIRYAALGYQQITSLGSSTALTVPAGATTAYITAEAQAVRYRDDGTAPTATVGQPLAVGTLLIYTGPLANIRFIEQTSGAKLNISYYK